MAVTTRMSTTQSMQMSRYMGLCRLSTRRMTWISREFPSSTDRKEAEKGRANSWRCLCSVGKPLKTKVVWEKFLPCDACSMAPASPEQVVQTIVRVGSFRSAHGNITVSMVVSQVSSSQKNEQLLHKQQPPSLSVQLVYGLSVHCRGEVSCFVWVAHETASAYSWAEAELFSRHTGPTSKNRCC